MTLLCPTNGLAVVKNVSIFARFESSCGSRPPSDPHGRKRRLPLRRIAAFALFGSPEQPRLRKWGTVCFSASASRHLFQATVSFPASQLNVRCPRPAGTPDLASLLAAAETLLPVHREGPHNSHRKSHRPAAGDGTSPFRSAQTTDSSTPQEAAYFCAVHTLMARSNILDFGQNCRLRDRLPQPSGSFEHRQLSTLRGQLNKIHLLDATLRQHDVQLLRPNATRPHCPHASQPPPLELLPPGFPSTLPPNLHKNTKSGNFFVQVC
jgi:hypothetical protein